MSSLRTQLVAALVVLTVPGLIAVFLTRSEAADEPARVTRVLESLSDSRSDARLASVDSPVAAADQGGKNVAIDFERGRRVPLGVMEIPAIDLRTKFYEGVVDEAVELGPGHWPGTPWPGQTGNSVFAGHRTTYTHPFLDLDLLDPGARVRVAMRNGRPTTYRVFRTIVVPEAEYANVVLEQPRNKAARIITLFACTPKGSRTHRIIVQARATPAKDRSGRGSEEAKP